MEIQTKMEHQMNVYVKNKEGNFLEVTLVSRSEIDDVTTVRMANGELRDYAPNGVFAYSQETALIKSLASSEVGKRIDFNTGRGYTAEGQQITAEVVAQKLCEDFGDMRLLVLMTDHSRRLEYLYDLAELTPRAVLRHYDGIGGEVHYKRLGEYWGVTLRGDPVDTDYADWRQKPIYQSS